MKALLEIFIFTYNRSAYLKQTLEQFIDSPFKNYSITVLDNCSTDDTFEVYKLFTEKISTLLYHKNKVNIGPEANYLRAVELSNAEYTWVLCDDDFYNFSDCTDVFEILKSGKADTLIVSNFEFEEMDCPKFLGTPKQLIEKGINFFGTLTFIPSTIFRTAINQKLLMNSYRMAYTMFPQLVYCTSIYNDDRLVYISKKSLVVYGQEAERSFSILDFKKGFMTILNGIQDSKIRENAFFLNKDQSMLKSIIKTGLIYSSSQSSLIEKIKLVKFVSFPKNLLFIVFFLSFPLVKYFPLPTNWLMKNIKKGNHLLNKKSTSFIKLINLINEQKIKI